MGVFGSAQAGALDARTSGESPGVDDWDWRRRGLFCR